MPKLKSRPGDLPTPRQREFADFISAYRAEHGISPSHREMMERFGIGSTNGVFVNLAALKKKGIVDFVPGQSRTVRVISDGPLDPAPGSSALPTGPALTRRQSFVLRVIIDFLAEHGYPPTFREIGKATGITTPNGVASNLKVLRKKGYVEWGEYLGRSIRVLKSPPRSSGA